MSALQNAEVTIGEGKIVVSGKVEGAGDGSDEGWEASGTFELVKV